MKTYPLLLLIACMLVTCRQDRDEPALVAHLPITIRQGYGPFYPGFGELTPERPNDQLWGKTYQPVKGMPTYWSNVSKSMVWLNAHQLVYQNFLTGKISPENYRFLQKEWRWTPDTTKLSGRSIKCYVYVITGYDERLNKWAAMVDTNNNLDFGDETAFYPEAVNWKDRSYRDKDPQQIQYDVYQKGKIIVAHAPMVIKQMGSEFLYNFPQHAAATLRRGDKTYELLISSGFSRPDFERSDVVHASSILRSGKVDPNGLAEIDQYVELGGIKYRNKGIDSFHNWLELEPVNADATAYSLQVGHPFYPFSANEFSTGKLVSLANYKGKYVYVDFWETGCKPCVEDMPTLRKIYRGLDRNRFDFVSIVNDSPDRLSRFLTKNKLEWPQILSDGTNKLIETYHITGYPTSVLLDPDGNVIARDLRAEGLKEKLDELNLTR